jgi:hypothetical protein
MVILGLETRGTILQSGLPTGFYCEVSTGPARTILRAENSLGGSMSEAALTTTSGQLTLTYRHSTNTFACAFGNVSLTQNFAPPAGSYGVALRSGLHTVTMSHGGSHSEAPATGSFTATADNLQFTSQKP